MVAHQFHFLEGRKISRGVEFLAKTKENVGKSQSVHEEIFHANLTLSLACAMARLAKRQERQDTRAAKRQKRTEDKEARRATAAGGWWPGLRQRHATNGMHASHPDAITNADLKSVAQKPVKPRDDIADFGEACLCCI